jgi:hypothetical protein
MRSTDAIVLLGPNYNTLPLLNNARSCLFYYLVSVDNASKDLYVIHRIAVDYAAIEHCGLDEILSDNSCADRYGL